MITLSSAEAALKSYYLDAFTSQLNGDVSPFLNAIEKTSENVFGKDVCLTVAKSGMSGVRAGQETADLPTPAANRYYSIRLPLKNIYGTIEITDKALRASADSSGAFVNLLNAEMSGLVADAKANFARMLFGNPSGVICRSVFKDGETVEVDSVKQYFLNLPVTLCFAGRMKSLIDSIDFDASTVHLATPLTPPIEAGQPICIGDGEDGVELTGLRAIFEDETLYGHVKADEPYFAPQVKIMKRTELTEDDLINMVDVLEGQVGGKVNMILCSHRTKKQIAGLMSSARRIVNTTDIAAGYSSIYINDVPVYADTFCPENMIFFLNTDDFVLNQLCDWSWLEDEDGRILKQVPGKAAYTATLVKYAELVCKKPCGQGMIQLNRR